MWSEVCKEVERKLFVWVVLWESLFEHSPEVTVYMEREQAMLAVMRELLMHEREGKRCIIHDTENMVVYRTSNVNQTDDEVMNNEEILYIVSITETEVK